MKQIILYKNLLSLCLSLSLFALRGQINLVPNPSFENVVNCPSTNNNIQDCVNWMNFGNSPDYYNSCATFSGMAIPTCQFGYQFPRTGYGMPAIVTWLNPNSCGGNCREFIGTELTSTLVIGQKYFMSFYINNSGYPNNGVQKQIAANKIGLRFSTVPSNSINIAPINNTAHLFTNVIYQDTIAWFKISGSFVADSLYKYVVLGNFFDDANTDTTGFAGGQLVGNVGAYYYIDDVCVTTDSLFNDTWSTATKVNTIPENKFRIFPNPSSGKIYVSVLADDITEIKIYDQFGFLISHFTDDFDKMIDLTDCKNGIYYLIAETRTGSAKTKIIINQ